MDGDCALEGRQREAGDPLAQLRRCERRRLGDGAAPHAHRQRLRLEAGAPARRTRLRELVPAQEHADVLLVALGFEPLEKREHPQVTPAGAMQQKVSVVLCKVAPRGIERDTSGARRLPQQPAAPFVARLGPGIERSLCERACWIGDDQRLVVLEHGAETVAARAGTPRVVEREQGGCERRPGGAAVGAGRVLGESPPRPVVERDRDPVALVEGGRHGVGEAPAARLRGSDAVHHDQDLRGFPHAPLRVGLVQPH